MQRHTVTSTNLKSVGYDARTRVLEVEFNNGSVYSYFNIPVKVYFELITSASIGRYHNKFIRKDYEYRRLTPSFRKIRPQNEISPVN